MANLETSMSMVTNQRSLVRVTTIIIFLQTCMSSTHNWLGFPQLEHLECRSLMLSNLVAIQQSFYAMIIPTNEVFSIRLGFLKHLFTSENCWNGNIVCMSLCKPADFRQILIGDTGLRPHFDLKKMIFFQKDGCVTTSNELYLDDLGKVQYKIHQVKSFEEASGGSKSFLLHIFTEKSESGLVPTSQLP